jgi:hypothetical protein
MLATAVAILIVLSPLGDVRLLNDHLPVAVDPDPVCQSSPSCCSMPDRGPCQDHTPPQDCSFCPIQNSMILFCEGLEMSGPVLPVIEILKWKSQIAHGLNPCPPVPPPKFERA